MNKKYYAIIMAGGVGTRFWPLSTRQYPKQFHDMLGSGKTLIQQTVARFSNLIPSENILIATNEAYQALVEEQLPFISSDQILLEPAMRNTAPCILYSALKVYHKDPEGMMVIAPSDHWIDNELTFLKNIQTSFDFCEETNALLTLGISPNNPNTGYGYIKYETSENEIKPVQNFTEKPNLEKAQQFLADGSYLWNAGIFIWSAKSIIKAFEKNLPEMHQLFNQGAALYNTTLEKDFIASHYSQSQNISIDFGIMEKASNVFVLPVHFDWNDLGTWGSLYNKSVKDAQENATISGDVIYRDAQNNIIRTQAGKKVVIQGLENFIVVEKEDVLLICPKNKEQEIKDITAEVNTKFGDEFV